MLDLQILMTARHFALLLAGSLALMPAAARAEDDKPFSADDFFSQPREYTVEEIASDLAYGFCPLFLARQFGLDDPQLAERGFGTDIETAPDERFSEINMVTAKREDGRIAFGGSKGKACILVIDGPQREAALTALRERMSWTGLDFQPVDAPGPAVTGATIETFRAAVEDQFLYLQLNQIGAANPLVSAVMYAQEQ